VGTERIVAWHQCSRFGLRTDGFVSRSFTATELWEQPAGSTLKWDNFYGGKTDESMTVDTHLTLVRPSHGEKGLNNSLIYSTVMATIADGTSRAPETTVVAAPGLHHEGVGSVADGFAKCHEPEDVNELLSSLPSF